MIDLEQFLAQSGIDARSLDLWVKREWLGPERHDTGIILSELDAARARLIRDLKEDFGVNDEGVEIVLHLIDQLHGLRRVLVEIKTNMRTQQRRTVRTLRGHKPGRRPSAQRRQ